MNKQLEQLIKNNGILQDDLEKKLYVTMLRGVFEAACKDMNKLGTKLQEKEFFRKSPNKVIATKMILNKYVGCALEEYEYEELSKLLAAFFQAGESRKIYDEEYRNNLIKEQGGICKICGKRIDLHNSHLDHVIPWSYVGDLLKDNYQMLCSTCNTRKGTATYYEISMLLLNK